MPMIWRSRPQLVLVLSSAILFEAFSVPLEGRRWGPGPGVTTPAPKVGWSVRIPAANQARGCTGASEPRPINSAPR
jgi:hypothetical protein